MASLTLCVLPNPAGFVMPELGVESRAERVIDKSAAVTKPKRNRERCVILWTHPDPEACCVRESAGPLAHGSMPSRTISHFQLVEEIGFGGSGVVWKAHDTVLGRSVALKFLKDAGAADPSSRERFRREAEAASALNHPNIVTIYEINFDGEEPFIAMELVDGKSLSDLLRERHRLPAGLTVHYALQLLNGLGAAHRAGIVHRDIKPSNIMLRQDGIIKILDFGLAKASVRESSDGSRLGGPLSAEGTAVGTVPYMSPEQAAGDPVGPRSDVFSVGTVLYEMLSGERPFKGSSNAKIMQALLSAEPAPLTSLAPEVPDALARIVHRCLQKNADDRYRDAGEVARDVSALDRTGWPRPNFDKTTVTVPSEKHPRDWIRQHPRLAAALALLVTVAGLGAAYTWLPWPKNPATSLVAAPAQSVAFQRAQAYLQRFDRKGNIDSAIAELERLAQHNASAAVYASLAEAYVRKFNDSSGKQWLVKALEAGRKAVATTEDLAAAHIGLGMALAANGQRTQAAAEFERAKELNPRSSPAHLGLAKLRSGKEAESLFQTAVTLSAGDWIPLSEMAAFYLDNARYDDSIEIWRQALKLSTDNVRLIRNIGVGFHMKGNYAQAAEYFQNALNLDESDGATWANLGTARYFLGQYTGSVRALEKALELIPNRYFYWGNLGDAYRWAPGLRNKAAGAYRSAIRLARERQVPGDTTIGSRIAVYLAKSGDIAGAREELGRIGEALERDGAALMKAAVIYELAGERKTALDYLERSVSKGYSVHEIVNEPELAALRSDPGYTKIALTFKEVK